MGSETVPGGLSAVIIAKDEELDLPGTLESLQGLADEVVVLVGHESSDKTKEIAEASGALVAVRRFDDYASHKQAALDRATRRWVLSIDADERVSTELAAEIRAVLADAPEEVSGFRIPFAVFFLGRRLRYGGLGGETHMRLFRRERGRFVGGALHEGIATRGVIRRLTGVMRHRPYRDLADYLGKLDRYTTLAAKKRYASGRRFRVWHHLILPWEFFRRTVLRLGILDGGPGVVWAALSAFHSWLKYVKLAEMNGVVPQEPRF